MTVGLFFGQPHDWRAIVSMLLCRSHVARGHRAPFQWGVFVLSPATAGQRDAVLYEIGCVTPTHRRFQHGIAHRSRSSQAGPRRTDCPARRRRTPTLLSRPLPYQSIGCMQSIAVAQVASRCLPRGRGGKLGSDVGEVGRGGRDDSVCCWIRIGIVSMMPRHQTRSELRASCTSMALSSLTTSRTGQVLGIGPGSRGKAFLLGRCLWLASSRWC
jgi:hypothetical protein